MSFRRFAMMCGPLAGLALGLAAPALAAAPGDTMPGVGAGMPAAPHMPARPGAPPPPGTPDMRPVWHGAAAPMMMMPDPRTRDAWLSECSRRTAMYYGGYRKSRRHRDDWHARDSAYGYCEAYFDDYYRTYADRGQAQAYAYMVPVHAAPMVMSQAPMAQSAKENCVETVTTEYVAVRTRIIPRRPAPRRGVPDKRVRDKRLLID